MTASQDKAGSWAPHVDYYTCPACGRVEEDPKGRACGTCPHVGDWIQPLRKLVRQGMSEGATLKHLQRRYAQDDADRRVIVDRLYWGTM